MNNDAAGKLQLPSTGLLIGAGLNLFFGAIGTLSGLARLFRGFEAETAAMSVAEKNGFYASTALVYGAGLLSLIFAPLIFYGALNMSSAQNLRWARAAAILAILPVSCCFPLSSVFGVWALVALSKPEVKTLFAEAGFQANNPPRS